MKTIKYTPKNGLPVFHLQTKTQDGFIISMKSDEVPKPDDILETWERSYTVVEVIESRPSTQDYGHGVRGNFYKVRAELLKIEVKK